MLVKLVRFDVDIPKKITLTHGNHIIGRGTLLEVDDKRVSRKHAKIEVTNDSVIITSLHHNPVFYTKTGCSKSEALTLNSIQVLSNGDRIGLLPKIYWFEIIVINEAENTTQQNNKEVNEIEDSEKHSEQTLTTVEESHYGVNQDETSLMPEAAQLHNSQEPHSNMSPVKRRRSASQDTLDTDSQNSEFDGSKKIKFEPADSHGDVPQTNNPNDAAPSSSIQQGNPSTSVRERCYYGERCYRRNPVHLVQFSHPRDSDWGTGEKGVCPNGAYCTKNDPRHWDTHTHPSGTVQLPQLRGKPKTKKKRKQREDTTDESDQDLDGNSVRACRRNGTDSACDPYASDIDFEESEPDPYGSDESDEWHPTKNGK